MEWHEAVDKLTPHVVQITSPQSSGTGFLLSRAKTQQLCGIATAAHVVEHAHYWEQPLRIRLTATGEVLLVRAAERAILIDSPHDTAVVVFDPKDLSLPDEPLELIEAGSFLKVGGAVGWLGFPAIPSADLCFFTGAVSAWVDAHKAYFVDGVAINGVSGGPAFTAFEESGPFVIGVVSAYMPNRATGEALPGLAIVRDVTQFHEIAQKFRSLEEAKSEQTVPAQPPPPPPSPAPSVPSSARSLL